MQITWANRYDIRRSNRNNVEKIEVWQGDNHLFSLAGDFPVDLLPEVCRVCEITQERVERAGRRAQLAWCLHVRASDEVHPAPNYETALKWADYIFERFDKSTILKGDGNRPLLRAVPAPWPWSAESHAADLEKSIADWTPGGQKSPSTARSPGTGVNNEDGIHGCRSFGIMCGTLGTVIFPVGYWLHKQHLMKLFRSHNR